MLMDVFLTPITYLYFTDLLYYLTKNYIQLHCILIIFPESIDYF